MFLLIQYWLPWLCRHDGHSGGHLIDTYQAYNAKGGCNILTPVGMFSRSIVDTYICLVAYELGGTLVAGMPRTHCACESRNILEFCCAVHCDGNWHSWMWRLCCWCYHCSMLASWTSYCCYWYTFPTISSTSKALWWIFPFSGFL
jgi:hypothetical protein